METTEQILAPKPTKKKTILAVIGITILLLIIVFAALTFYYQNRWHPTSTINGIDLSGMTYEDSVAHIRDTITTYELEIKGRNDGTVFVDSDDIELEADFEAELSALYEQQRDDFFLSAFFGTFQKDITITFSYSETMLRDTLTESAFVTETSDYSIIAPESAYIIYAEDDACYTIIPEEYGCTVDIDQLCSAVAEAVLGLRPSIDITSEENYPAMYIAPDYLAADEEIRTLYYQANGYLLNWFEWDMDLDVIERIEPGMILEWLEVDNATHTATLNEAAVEAWLTDFCLRYKTVEGARSFTTHSGRTIEISGGDYGWRIDYDKERARVLEVFHAAPDTAAIDSYLEGTSDARPDALVSAWEPLYSHTAYRKDYDNPMADWDTQNYSEVDLKEQMVYVYKDGNLVFSCRCVTGLPTDGTTRSYTPEGVWFIKEKKEEKTLTGDDYSVDSKWWVRITWTGIGYHWSNRNWSKWSPTLYQTKGSHGCVNLELQNAKTLYDLVTFNDVVFIYN